MSILLLQRVQVRRVTSLSFVVAALVGFATFERGTLSSGQTRPPVTSTCHSAQQCVVPVTVTCGASSCTMMIPGNQRVLAANGWDVVWVVAPGSGPYLFKNPGGVFFKNPQVVWDCHAEVNDTRFRCKSKQRDGKGYEYGIDLVGPKPVTILDPSIVND